MHITHHSSTGLTNHSGLEAYAAEWELVPCSTKRCRDLCLKRPVPQIHVLDGNAALLGYRCVPCPEPLHESLSSSQLPLLHAGDAGHQGVCGHVVPELSWVSHSLYFCHGQQALQTGCLGKNFLGRARFSMTFTGLGHQFLVQQRGGAGVKTATRAAPTRLWCWWRSLAVVRNRVPSKNLLGCSACWQNDPNTPQEDS